MNPACTSLPELDPEPEALAKLDDEIIGTGQGSNGPSRSPLPVEQYEILTV